MLEPSWFEGQSLLILVLLIKRTTLMCGEYKKVMCGEYKKVMWIHVVPFSLIK